MVLSSWLTRNYLRVRGEYFGSVVAEMDLWELPPRARRIPVEENKMILDSRTTSACAENTLQQQAQQGWIGNYLRVRGEYRHPRFRETINLELPPRARRIRLPEGYQSSYAGTTSACAENTDKTACPQTAPGNYLRVRGEYFFRTHRREKNAELPPRARRIRRGRHFQGLPKGTTSACAENTAWWTQSTHSGRNYLRVRGEYIPSRENTG